MNLLNQPRGVVQERLLYMMAQGLTADQFERGKSYIENMTDNEFIHFQLELSQFAPTDLSLKDHINTLKEFQKANGVTPENTARKSIPISFISETANAKLLKLISQSKPSDIIKLTRDSDKQLMDLWEDSNNTHVRDSGVSIPSDLFFAETMPLLDCRIVIDEREYIDNGTITSYRVVIFDDYIEQLRKCDCNTIVTVGAVIMDDGTIGAPELIIPISVAKGVDVLVFTGIGWSNMSKEHRDYISKHVAEQTISSGAVNLLETWYGIQIALLHPIVRDVFKNPKVSVRSNNRTKKSKKSKNRKVKYIKEHILNKDVLDRLIYGESDNERAFTRHALVWYVIGHWRTYKDGRKVFIKPYWKGALRELKQAIPERERQIAQVV